MSDGEQDTRVSEPDHPEDECLCGHTRGAHEEVCCAICNCATFVEAGEQDTREDERLTFDEWLARWEGECRVHPLAVGTREDAWDEFARENIGSDVGAALPHRAFVAGYAAAEARYRRLEAALRRIEIEDHEHGPGWFAEIAAKAMEGVMDRG